MSNKQTETAFKGEKTIFNRRFVVNFFSLALNPRLMLQALAPLVHVEQFTLAKKTNRPKSLQPAMEMEAAKAQHQPLPLQHQHF
jgi:hypothetical protein